MLAATSHSIAPKAALAACNRTSRCSEAARANAAAWLEPKHFRRWSFLFLGLNLQCKFAPKRRVPFHASKVEE